jgi:hypothetical protein
MIEILNPRGEKSGWTLETRDRSLIVTSPKGDTQRFSSTNMDYRQDKRGNYRECLYPTDPGGNILRPYPGYTLPRFVEKRALKEVWKNQARLDLAPGATIYTLMMHRSRSGMLRVYKVMTVVGGIIIPIGAYCREILGYSLDDNRNVKVSGCGFSGGGEIVDNLSRALYPDGPRFEHREM